MSRRDRFPDSPVADATRASPRTPNSASDATPDRTAPSCYDDEVVARALPRSRARNAFNGVKVFSATKFAERDRLGEVITRWLAEHPDLEIVDRTVTQSSDAEFHCIAICLFFLETNTRVH
jgi:hypothetical protein